MKGKDSSIFVMWWVLICSIPVFRGQCSCSSKYSANFLLHLLQYCISYGSIFCKIWRESKDMGEPKAVSSTTCPIILPLNTANQSSLRIVLLKTWWVKSRQEGAVESRKHTCKKRQHELCEADKCQWWRHCDHLLMTKVAGLTNKPFLETWAVTR